MQRPYALSLEPTDDELARLFAERLNIAVLGIKTAEQRGQPAYDVAAYMQQAGHVIRPVPVYYPDVTEILGSPVWRTVAEVPSPIDIANVFRRSQDVAAHGDDVIAAKPALVWLQLGIRDDVTAARLRDAGIPVIQDRCLLVEHRRLARA